MLSELFKRNRRLLNESIQDPRRRTYISPAVYATDRALLPALAEHARGVLLDVGAGDVPYRSLLAGQVDRHDTFDVEHRTDALTYVGDIHDMHMVADNAYDTVLCLSVLEHVREPFRAIGELARILRPGRLILTVPHLSRLHEEPHDYFRYTQYGLRSLLESAGSEDLHRGGGRALCLPRAPGVDGAPLLGVARAALAGAGVLAEQVARRAAHPLAGRAPGPPAHLCPGIRVRGGQASSGTGGVALATPASPPAT